MHDRVHISVVETRVDITSKLRIPEEVLLQDLVHPKALNLTFEEDDQVLVVFLFGYCFLEILQV